jgi:hypothetical protein
MTIFSQGNKRDTLSEELAARGQRNCHPDRSAAKWRDLLFLLLGEHCYN